MVKIRLSRVGKKNDPFYRIVAIEENRKREGKPLEILGYWYPAKDTKEVNKKRLKSWVDNGAVFTKAVNKLL